MSSAKKKYFLATITGRALRGITNFIASSKRVIEQKVHARIPHMHFIILLLPLYQTLSAVYNFTTVPSYPVYPTSSASI